MTKKQKLEDAKAHLGPGKFADIVKAHQLVTEMNGLCETEDRRRVGAVEKLLSPYKRANNTHATSSALAEGILREAWDRYEGGFSGKGHYLMD